MSGPPNINNGPPGGGGRGWLRTPPPTYFRSPSPWVPPGSTPNIQRPASLTGSSEPQYFPRYDASPTYLVQPVYSYQYGEVNETQNQTAINVNTVLQTNSQNQTMYGTGVPRKQDHTKKERASTHMQPPKQKSAVAKNVAPASQRVQPMTPINQMDSTFQRPQSRGPTVRHPTPSFQYGHFEHPTSIEASNQPQYVIYDYSGEAGPSTAEIIANQSQDYVDEKLAEYQATIHLLQDEQERVQKKTFVNWINSFLIKRNPPLKIVDLIHDLKDGTKLLALLEVLSGHRLPMEKGKILRRPHYLSN